MTNLEKYKEAFVVGLDIPVEQVKEGLIYESVDNWDSVGHMAMIAEIEYAFNILMKTDDILEFDSFEKGIEILKKYDVVIC